MCHRPLTQAAVVGLFFVGCGKDPILERVESMNDAEIAAAGSSMPKGGETVTPGVPEEPEPGIPGEVRPAAPGSPQGIAGASFEDEGDTGGTHMPGDPEEPDPGTPEEPSPGMPEDPSPAPAGSTEGAVRAKDGTKPTMTPGIPEEPAPAPAGSPEGTAKAKDGTKPTLTPGIPEEPAPAPPGSPGGEDHPGKQGGINPDAEGPQALVRGQVTSSVEIRGRVRIDVFDGDQRNRTGPRPNVVAVHELERPSWFELSIPAVHNRVWVGAYADLNDNKRPDKGEPAGWYRGNPVFLSEAPSSISIDLVVEGKATGLGLDFGGP